MPDFDPNKPSITRVYDYLLGGTDNFAVDREQGARLIQVFPPVADLVPENRRFLARAVAWVANQGVVQFIDLGCGMPTAPNTHETAQAIDPTARVAYVDNDPVALFHLQALIEKRRPGVTVTDGDAGNPDVIIGTVAEGLDLTAPTCLIMGLLLHFYRPDAARALVSRYTAALVPGSYIVISMARGDGPAADRWFSTDNTGVASARNYSMAEATTLFDGMQLMPPGLVDARQWHPGRSNPPPMPSREGQAISGVARITNRDRLTRTTYPAPPTGTTYPHHQPPPPKSAEIGLVLSL